MRRILLVALLIFPAGLVRAQETTGPVAEEVRNQIMGLVEQEVNCFSSIGEVVNNWCADWLKWHLAEGHLHYSDHQRSKTELMDEVRSGIRRNIADRHFNHKMHIYGDGGDGTLVIDTYSTDTTLQISGIVHSAHGFGIDVWSKQGGRWWYIVHCPHGNSGSATAGAPNQPVVAE